MGHLSLAVQHQFGVKTGEAIVLRSEGNIVIGGEILQMDPALPGRNKRARVDWDERTPFFSRYSAASLLVSKVVITISCGFK